MRHQPFTRRQFLAAGAALPFAWRALAQGNTAPRWVFLGTDKGKGIYRARWDAAKGKLGAMELAVETDRPDFFAMHPVLPVLYTVDSVAGEKAGVSGYRVDRSSGALTLINRLSSHGDGPCAVSVDKSGRVAFVANYTGGSIAAYHIGADGSLLDSNNYQCHGNAACGPLGPVKDRQDASHLHCVTVAPGNDFVVVCDLGADAIEVFPFSAEGDPILGKPVRVGTVRHGVGPRHVAFHPNGKKLYCINELECTVDPYVWNGARDARPLSQIADAEVSTLTASAVGLIPKQTTAASVTPATTGNTACEIFVSKDGRFVYTCTRGVDEIVVYRVDPATGLLNEHQRVSSGGKIPRYIALDPSRKWLLCCNQGAAIPNPVGNVTIFAHDAATGKLSEKPKTFAAETPMFTLFV